MSTNGRKGNRTSIPVRGGARRSNTPPPPSLGPGESSVPESDPISTSRPRNEGDIPVLNKPPADVVVAAAAAAEPEPTAKSPPVAAAPPEPIPPPRAPVPTLLSAADSIAPRVVTQPLDDEPPYSQPPPSARSVTGSGPVSRRRGRNSNLPGSGRTSAPPATTSRPPLANPPPAPPAPPVPAASVVAADEAPVAPEPVVAKSAPPPAEAPKAKPASIPPPSDNPASAVPASDLDRSFFERGDSQPHGPAVDDSDLENDDDPRMKHKNSPEARARRERNWMYVLGAAAGCVVLMGVALMRNGSRRVEEPVAQNNEPPVIVTVVPSSAPPKVETAPSAAAAAPSASVAAAPSASTAIPVASTDDLPSASPSASAKPGEPAAPPGAVAKAGEPGGASATPTAPMAEPTEAEKKSAVQDKRACQSFLDQGAFAKAVEAGERAVALDPTDGDTWLMLGAAYQSMGKSAEARRSFSSCVAEGKRGQINECRSMLR